MSSSSVPSVHQPIRFLALGDSYTIGEGVASGASWPFQLMKLLRDAGLPCATPEIVARTGWTTDELKQGITEAGIRGTFDLVSLLIGVNNHYRGRGVEEYSMEFTELLFAAKRFAGGDGAKVVVVSIPDWGVTPFAGERDRAVIARGIDLFNAAARKIALRAGCHYVDVTDVSRKKGARPEFLVGDGLHPSGAMYAEWAAVVYHEMSSCFKH